MDNQFPFEGDSCFPLEPLDKKKKSAQPGGKYVISKNDQLKIILRELGTQSDEQLSFISTQNSISYIKDLEKGN